MAGAADPDPPPPPKTSLFLGCFGFTGKRSDNSSTIPDELHRKRRRSTFLPKQSAAATKTGPLKKNSAVFSKSKSAALDVPLKPPTPPPVKAPEEHTPLETKSLDKRVTVEDGKVRKDCNGRNEPFRRRAVTVSQPGSPDGLNRKTMTRATSLPVRVSTKLRPREITANDKLEPVMGMSIIAVTLVIMLIWGRLFAVLCTCTWLYFVSRPTRKPDLTNGLVLSDLEPEEYMKKRVVFEGFLERSRNHSFS